MGVRGIFRKNLPKELSPKVLHTRPRSGAFGKLGLILYPRKNIF
jgi:hypothetical protein